MKKTKELIIERAFEAPLEKVWKAVTNPDEVKKWWGPKGFTCPFASIDLQEGGKFLNSMKSPEGKEYWSTGVYKEISPMDYLIFTDCFADEKGNVVPASYYGMSEDFPLEMMAKIKFEEKDGKTKLTITHIGMPKAEIENAKQGWNESLDKLEENL